MRIIVLTILVLGCMGYLEFQLKRIQKHGGNQGKSECQDPKTIDQECKYQEICLQKDLAYTIQFYQHPVTYKLALDLTTPISWIKGQSCKIVGTSQKCTLIEENFAQRINNALRHRVTELVKKLKIKIADEQSDKAIIEGSNEIVMGELQKVRYTSLIGKNTAHDSQFFDMIMLGLFIIGQKDIIDLNETTFMKAHQISPNLDGLQDGAISMRFDQNSESSFLSELFKYSKAQSKIISLYLGELLSVVTVGNYETKFMRDGLGGLKRIKIEQDQKHGKLPSLQAIILQHPDIQDGSMEDNSSVVFTLSSSFLAFSNTTIKQFIHKFLSKSSTCKLSPYLQCSFKQKQDLQSFIGSTINLDFESSIISFALSQLVLHKDSRKVKLNIKQSLNNYTIIGEPFFLKYYVYFDYANNQIGFTDRALSIEESFIGIVTFMHCLMMAFLFGICLILSSQKFRALYYRMFERMVWKAQPTIDRLKTVYRPIGSLGEEESREGRGQALDQDIEGI